MGPAQPFDNLTWVLDPAIGDPVVVQWGTGNHGGRGFIDHIRDDEYGVRMIEDYDGAKVNQFIKRTAFTLLVRGMVLTNSDGEVWPDWDAVPEKTQP